MSIPLILASKSKARRDVLFHAGIRATIRVSHVDEPAVVASTAAQRGIAVDDMTTEDRVPLLARAKAAAVYREYMEISAAAAQATGEMHVSYPLTDGFGTVAEVKSVHQAIEEHEGLTDAKVGPLIIGCDSMFELDGVPYGKPHTEAHARERLRLMRGRTGTLWTGHCVIDAATGRMVSRASHAEVTFCDFSDEMIDRYIATGEPLEVAGSFTLDGFGGAFIDRIEGDPSGIIGLSLPLARQLVEELGITWTDLWNIDREEQQEHGVPVSVLKSIGAMPPKENVHQPGDGFIDCACGQKHWGLNGASGVLLARRDPETGEVTHVLMQHRALWSAEGGKWGIPGGATADGESPLEGALRESFEEANIRPRDIDVVGSYMEDHGPWGYTTVFAFEKPGHVVQPHANDDESLEVTWVPIDEVGGLPLLTAMKTDWPRFEERLRKIARQTF
ncbi:septum formation inhibitor Maf [Bifidobacterium margollesii]|uniref:Nucleoside triphosphate pyrophosphatase n=1 Tax=Bifidobacterium margollesii TaxID=2020964 RepID=A0A2N5JB87_9BIFI|nr:Maf family nucleotide pyrophosphatase [Bifidobacterium margollesii]PLS31464.1 septum formation inhibitor Maf [Bifidobacterium margollesii]